MSWLQNPFKSPQLSDEHLVTSSVGGGGVREDLSEIGESIGRQLRGVAAFLAPPPTSSSQQPLEASSSVSVAADAESDGESTSERTFATSIRSDLEEIGGTFKSSLSLLSSNGAVTGLSKLASSFLRLEDEKESIDEYDPSLGLTEEVVEFAREISSRPECWTQFPLTIKDDFIMSDAQVEHASNIERLVPSFAALREILGSDMSERQFWMIYFIMLLPRLNESDGNLLSTPQILEARNAILLQLKNKKNSELSNSGNEQTDSSSQLDPKMDDEEVYKEASHEENIVLPLDATPLLETAPLKRERSSNAEEDFSFSDLEDDDDDDDDDDNDLPNRQQAKGSSSSLADGSSDWVQLSENVGTGRKAGAAVQTHSQSKRDSDGEDPNDWLTIDEDDCDN